MKTDYEFIKDKFDQSGVNAPESLNEDFVLEQIKDTKPKSSRKPLIAGLSAAAALAVITVSALVITSVIGNIPKPITVLKSGTAKLSSFRSTDDVKKAIREINSEREKHMNGDDIAVAENSNNIKNDYLSSFDAAAGSGSTALKSSDYGHNSTYTQYTNVDEADTVKTDGRYIYYLNNDSAITVFSTEGKNSKKVAEIEPKLNFKCFEDFYVSGNKLIVTADYSTQKYADTMYTVVEIYDISDIKDIRLADSFTQSGRYCSSRMIGSMMYVVSTHYSNNENDLPKAGKRRSATDDEAKPDELPCTDIYTVDKPSDANFLVVSSIDTSNGAQIKKTKAILGSAETVYCNTEHLFVTAAHYDFGKTYGDYYYMPTAADTQIVKVDLNNNLDFTATAKVKGYVDNQYALDEKDGFLRVAATENISGKETNCLFILDSGLKQVGKTAEFAKGESIKAVRYIGDTAYVITYEETDPLFVIDTKDAKNPKILGEVKISGFSTMLVPVDENTLLGIGYHTQDEEDDDIDMEIQEGIKLALFDVSDKANPKVLDEKVFKGYDSQVQYNPKALLVNFERNDYTIPYSRYTDTDDESLTDYGVINFKVQDGKIKIVDEYKSNVFGDSEDIDSSLERCVYTGNCIYMLGNYYNYNNDSGKVLIDAVEYK
ncbi:MAG: beta-propeller domain-containing protein [Ruminococcus sp.]|nr:beta-propeller domain-containing protein [Ruminococcus sp.]